MVNATEPKIPKRALAISAHPDDIDFGMSGTLSKWARKGTKVSYLILTNGSKGSSDPNMNSSELVKLRRREQDAAAKLLGVDKVYYLDYEDGELEITQALKRDIVRTIRIVKPDVVLTMDPSMLYSVEHSFINHPDHRAAGQAALDAVFPLARDRLSFPDLLREHLEPHETPRVLLVSFDNHNYYEDITETIELKIQALALHKSQGAHTKATQDRIRNRAADLSKHLKSCKYAEAFLQIIIQ
ncbi:MAG: PIG-L family deacetylase [Candidatus Saccharimonadales bacterium]